jgi:hypothetical protein
MANRTPNLWANPTNRPAKLWNLTWDQYLSLDGALWKAITFAFSFIALMSFFNKIGHQGWNLPITIIGYMFIWWFGLRPTHMAYSMTGGGIFAALFDRDKSQGVGSGPRVLFKVVQRVSYTFLLIGFSLFTWNFSGNIGAFWVTMIGIIILTQTGSVDRWHTKIIMAYVTICIIVSLWSTLGTYSGRSFDPATGQPLYMVDPSTGRIDSEGRTPKQCAENACFSAETGVGLVPMTNEQALKRNPVGIVDKAIARVGGMSLPSFHMNNFMGSDGVDCGTDPITVQEETRIVIGKNCTGGVLIDQNQIVTAYYYLDEAVPGHSEMKAENFVNVSNRFDGKYRDYLALYKPIPGGFAKAGIDKVTLVFSKTKRVEANAALAAAIAGGTK